jgi:hypothetical protein
MKDRGALQIGAVRDVGLLIGAAGASNSAEHGDYGTRLQKSSDESHGVPWKSEDGALDARIWRSTLDVCAQLGRAGFGREVRVPQSLLKHHAVV